MRTVKSILLRITASKHAFYLSVCFTMCINVWMASLSIPTNIILVLTALLWLGFVIHLWMNTRQEQIEIIEVGTDSILSVNMLKADDWHISQQSRQFLGMIWLVVQSKSQQKIFRSLLMQDSFELEIQWRQLKTIVRYMQIEKV